MPDSSNDQLLEGGVLNGRRMNASDGGASDNSGQDTRAPFGGAEVSIPNDIICLFIAPAVNGFGDFEISRHVMTCI